MNAMVREILEERRRETLAAIDSEQRYLSNYSELVKEAMESLDGLRSVLGDIDQALAEE